MACGLAPTGIGGPARLVVRSTGVTVAEAEFTTNAVGCRAPPAAGAPPGVTAARFAAAGVRVPVGRASRGAVAGAAARAHDRTRH
jgi:hypothetical protein